MSPVERKSANVSETKIIHSDQQSYYKYMGAARFDKAVNTLLGIIQGISMDSRIHADEVALLGNWLDAYVEFSHRHPFNELVPVIKSSIEDGYLDEDERWDLVWICEKLRSTEYFDLVTADIQCLHGILAGIQSDGLITQSELEGLSEWVRDHEHLCGCWPFDEVGSLLSSILSDRKVDESEIRLFKHFCSEFVASSGSRAIGQSIVSNGCAIKGLCAVCPTISFPGSVFCFTGTSATHPRKDLIQIAEELRGKALKSVTQELDYLVIGAGSNPCWAYACYGRKVEQAVALRKQGHNLLLVHENDFLDAAEEARIRQQGL